MIDIVKVGEEHISAALDMRMEMLSVVNGAAVDNLDRKLFDLSAEYFTNGDQTTVLAYDGNTAVGCASICYITLMPTYSHPTGKRAHIMNVYTRESHRRKGIARRMMAALLDEAKQRGVTHISLDATESGKPLYKSLGFNTSGEAMGMNLI
ncbi:MAG: GNAT family N-acetyltransferase [Ruminococcaceae bacterium]|nr:GNAT family N-acetyltransferase [Oscillospiraceae bacterium]